MGKKRNLPTSYFGLEMDVLLTGLPLFYIVAGDNKKTLNKVLAKNSSFLDPN